MQIKKNRKAILDIDGDYDYLVEIGGFHLAERFISSLEETFSHLRAHPKVGEPLPTTQKSLIGLRHCVVINFPKYLIFYIPRRDAVAIMRVGHEARNWWRILSLE